MGWGLNVGTSLIGMSGVATINNTGIIVNLPVPPKLEELLVNATISAIGLTNSTTSTAITTQMWETYYLYSKPLRLVLAYGIASLLSVIAVVIGFTALWLNGVAADRGFFQILSTTRNPELDALCDGQLWGGGRNMPKSLKEAPLRYGTSWDGSRTFFGTDATVRSRESRGVAI